MVALEALRLADDDVDGGDAADEGVTEGTPLHGASRRRQSFSASRKAGGRKAAGGKVGDMAEVGEGGYVAESVAL